MAVFKLYLALIPLMIAGDLFWIGYAMSNFYRNNLGHLMATGVNWIPALLFYFIFVAGLLYFAILPGIATGSLVRTVLTGALFGFVAYATYDLTNHATLKDWPVIVTIVDMLWGAFLSGLLSATAFWLSRLFA